MNAILPEQISLNRMSFSLMDMIRPDNPSKAGIIIIIIGIFLSVLLPGCGQSKNAIGIKETAEQNATKQTIAEQNQYDHPLRPEEIQEALKGIGERTLVYITIHLDRDNVSIIKVKPSKTNAKFNIYQGQTESTFFNYRWQLLDENGNELMSRVIRKQLDKIYDPNINQTKETVIVPKDPDMLVNIYSVSNEITIYSEQMPYYERAKTFRLQRLEKNKKAFNYVTIGDVSLK